MGGTPPTPAAPRPAVEAHRPRREPDPASWGKNGPAREESASARTTGRETPSTGTAITRGRGADRKPRRAAVSPQTASRGRPVSPRDPGAGTHGQHPPGAAPHRPPPPTPPSVGTPRQTIRRGWRNRVGGGGGNETRARADGRRGTAPPHTGRAPRSGRSGASGLNLGGRRRWGQPRRTGPGACDTPAASPAELRRQVASLPSSTRGGGGGQPPAATAPAETIDLQATLRQA